MSSWKRDFASGLIVLGPVLVSAYVVAWIYGIVAGFTPEQVVSPALLEEAGLNPAYTEFVRVLVALVVFVILVFAVGYLMRTTVGALFESALDDVANRVPGLRVVYNASKMAAQTAFGGTDSLQTPVKMEPWKGMRMTAFKTGKRTEDGREVVFLPTAPNITTGFVLEVDPEDLTETDERVEDALTRILSAGFGDNQGSEASIEEILDEGSAALNDGTDADTTRSEEPPRQDD
ncbi:hypothetical protein BRD00_04865 [Halobacteriales archaeon QS_8_69_26]|nr:MAG: hypothetical protein BRD00_04865 [Halobacteriales archaeon QS_8_69_26]